MCIKTPTTNPHFSLLNEARPKPCSRPSPLNAINTSDPSSISIREKKPPKKTESMTSMKRPYASKFDKAIRVYISHFTEKSMRKALKEATSQEETPPAHTATQTLIASGGLSVSLVKEMQKIPLEYKAGHLESTASIHSELGNSIHNSSSVARRSVDLYGVRVWKGLCVVHGLLREEKGVDEGVKEELLWWFDVLGHDLGLEGGERGYGHLLKFYITYLKAFLPSVSPVPASPKSTLPSRPSPAHTHLQTHHHLSLSSHTLRSSLLLSITSSPPSTSGAKLAALRLVILDALAFPVIHEKLVGLMRREGVCEAIVEERECVFERRREEVVGFVRRCEELGLGLNLEIEMDLEGERKGGEVEELAGRVEELRV